MSLPLAALCVTVNCPGTEPASLASVLPRCSPWHVVIRNVDGGVVGTVSIVSPIAGRYPRQRHNDRLGTFDQTVIQHRHRDRRRGITCQDSNRTARCRIIITAVRRPYRSPYGSASSDRR